MFAYQTRKRVKQIVASWLKTKPVVLKGQIKQDSDIGTRKYRYRRD
jgi:hypothetical protein